MPLQFKQHGVLHFEFQVASCTRCLWYGFTLLLKEPVTLFLRELRVLFTLAPFSTFSVRSSSSSFLKPIIIEHIIMWKYLFSSKTSTVVNISATLVIRDQLGGQYLLNREELVPSDISWNFRVWSVVPLLRSVEEQHDDQCGERLSLNGKIGPNINHKSDFYHSMTVLYWEK